MSAARCSASDNSAGHRSAICEESVRRLRKYRLHAALLRSEVAPDRACGKPCGRGDVVAAGAGTPRSQNRAQACLDTASRASALSTTAATSPIRVT